jgi:pyridoxine 5'-phosphate synthase PdxJ
MRLDGDYRPAAVFKQEAVRALRASGLDIRLYFEDDKRTVELLRTEGLPTLYVHSGYYD